MKTLEEVTLMLKEHNAIAEKDGRWLLPAEKKRHARERERLVLMRNYLERVSPEHIAANHKRLSDQIQRLEARWEQHSATFPNDLTSTVLSKRREEFEEETELPKLKKQLKEISWLVQ